jgi:peptidoglycan/LPS O-acetylase OafA/YrhL
LLYTPWSWLPRIVAQFAAGALACAAVRRLRLGDTARRGAGYLSVLLVFSMVALLYYYAAHPVSGMVDPGGLVALLFMPLVVTLAIGVGVLPTLLSTRVMVYGGQISFSLYMIHEPIHTAWNWAVAQYAIDLPKSTAKLVVLGLVIAAVAAAMLLFHSVEEPARRWMRRMIDFRDVEPGPPRPRVAPTESTVSVQRPAAPALPGPGRA